MCISFKFYDRNLIENDRIKYITDRYRSVSTKFGRIWGRSVPKQCHRQNVYKIPGSLCGTSEACFNCLNGTFELSNENDEEQ